MNMVLKTVASDGGLDFVLSDETVDRYGDIVEASGWVLTNFRKNPIALFGHSSAFPIGKWTNIRIEGGKLIARLQLAARGTSARIDELISLVEQGILRAVSVGFRPLESEPIDEKKPYGSRRFKKQELLECSLVSVPANPSALQLAKSLNISDETLSLAFGEQAEMRRRDVTATGEHADLTTVNEKRTLRGLPSLPRTQTMKTVSQRLEEAKAMLTAKQERHAEILNAHELDADALESVTAELTKLEKDVEVLQRAEAALAKGAGKDVSTPAIARRPLGFPQKEVKPVDLVIRKAVVQGVSLFTGKDVDKVLEERYPDHEATHLIVKAPQGPATTAGSNYVSDLQQTTYQGFVDALDGMSVFPRLRSAGLSLSLDSAGTAYVPGVAAGGANGSFFKEGDPIRVGRITTNNVQLTSRKIGVIMAFSREAAKRSTPDIEALFRRRILADTAAVIDAALLDANAQTDTRPGGLLYDQVATAAISATASGYGGGDHVAVMNDFKALLAPFISANAADGITVIMNPAQGLAMDFMTSPDGTLGDWFARARARFSFLESTHATAARLIAVRAQDFASAVGGIEFEMSNQATLHMEDTSPAEIVATGPTAAAPVRSLYQTDTQAIRMVMDINWRMMRQGVVRWIDGTSW
jgi:HK97 family phage prohead protease